MLCKYLEKNEGFAIIYIKTQDIKDFSYGFRPLSQAVKCENEGFPTYSHFCDVGGVCHQSTLAGIL